MKTLKAPLVLCIFLVHAQLASAQDSASIEKLDTIQGKIVPLSDVLKLQGTKLDPDASPHWLALVGDDGKTYLLVKDDGSRMLFKDAELLNRPTQLTGKVLPGSNLFKVTNVFTIVDGKPHEVYYWCEFCALRDSEPGICKCCGRILERKAVAVEKDVPKVIN